MLLRLRPGDPRLWLIAVIILLNQFSISALNDWSDADLDAASERPRPIPLGLLPRESALILAIAFGILSVTLSLLGGLGFIATLLLVVGLACGWLYDLVLKRMPLSFVPFAIAFPLMAIWVGVIAHRPPASFRIMVIGGVPLAIAIHLADAIPDRAHDAAAGVRTLAARLGRPAGEIAASGLLLVGSGVAAFRLMERGAIASGILASVAIAILYLTLSFVTGDAPWARYRPALARWSLIGGSVYAALLLVLGA